MAISFFLHEVSIKLIQRKALKAYLYRLFEQEKVELKSLTYVLCNDEYLLGINKEFLKHDTLTDIVTFSLADAGEPVIGEVYISIDRVEENARKFKVTVNNELHRVIFHGALHLCGYKDKKMAEIKLMRSKESQSLEQYFNDVPRGTSGF